MSTNEPESMKEIRIIRESLSEELKKMTPAERVAYIHSQAEEFERESGLNLPHSGNDVEKTA